MGSPSAENVENPTLSPLGGIYSTNTRSYTASSMERTRQYHRGLYRLPLRYPAMYCVYSTVGEGTISNISAVGCTIETDEPLLHAQQLALRLILPDKTESLPIDSAQVRWVQGTRAGVEFLQVDREANLRLHSFVWDRMIERIQFIHQQRSALS